MTGARPASARVLAATFGAVGALALAAAGWAARGAVYATPTLSVAQAGSVSRIVATVAPTDDGTARLALYPPPLAAVTTSQVPGTTLGRATLTVSAFDLGGALVPFSGVVAVPAVQLPPEPACLAGQPPTAIWSISVRAVARTVELPLFAVATGSPPETGLPPVKLLLCLPPAGVPVGTPGRALFGGKLVSAELVLGGVVGPASGGAWLAAWTPFAGGAIDEGATVVSPATLRPGAVRVSVSATGNGVVARGVVTQADRPRGDARVELLAGPRATSLRRVAVGSVRADGAFSLRTPARGRFFRARAIAAPRRDVELCASPLPAPCLNPTVAGFTALSPVVAVTPPS